MKRLCPLTFSKPRGESNYCEENSTCAWWVKGYTTEKLPIECCAMEFIALKGDDGLYRV